MRGEAGTTRPRERAVAFLRRRWPDLLGIAWIVVFVVLYLAPALKDGPTFGPADLGRGNSLLTSLAHAVPNHNGINGDTIDQGVPWNTLDWRLVHRGELPLWNDLSGNGMPQLLNFESAPLALPTLVGYLFPLSLAFLVTVGVKLLLAGTGAYVLSRLLGARPLAAAFGGTTAMLSGAFAGWLGWSITGPLALAGWIAAAAVLCVRSRRSVWPVALLAVAVAFAIYGGFPESYVLLAGALTVLLGAWWLLRLRSHRGAGLAGAGRVAAGLAAGLALSAPLWLPGVAVLRASARAGTQAATGLPLHMATLLFAQGYYGLPIRGSYFFGSWNYYETAAYVGVLAVVACVVAVVTLWRRPVVVALTLSGLACLALVYDLGPSAPVQHLVSDVGLGTVALQRALPLVGFAAAVLAALGVERLAGAWHERSTRVALWLGCGLVAVVLGAMWSRVGTAAFAPGAATPYSAKPLPSDAVLASLRRASLWWPTASLVLVAACAALLSLAARRRDARPVGPGAARRHAGRAPAGPGAAVAGALLAAQSAFLLFAGVGINSYAPDSFPATPATTTLARIAGTRLVGIDDGLGTCSPPSLVPPRCGVRTWRGIGFYPEMNLGYGIDELGLHDPVIPQALFDGWPQAGTGRHLVGTNLFTPDIDSVALARRYGAAFVLVAPGLPVPAGMTPVATLANHGAAVQLVSVPGATRFSVVGGGGRLVSTSHPGDARYDVQVRAPAGAELVARITDVPGWRASAGGRALVVHRAPGDLLEVRLPPGTSQVRLVYAPARLLLGELAALAALAVLGAWALVSALRRRARPVPGRAPSRRLAGSLGQWPGPPPSSAPTPTRSTLSSSSTSEPSTPS